MGHFSLKIELLSHRCHALRLVKLRCLEELFVASALLIERYGEAFFQLIQLALLIGHQIVQFVGALRLGIFDMGEEHATLVLVGSLALAD